MDDKKKLKRLLLRMYILAKKGKSEETQKLNWKYRALQKKIFGSGGSKEDIIFDRAANNIIMSTGNYDKKEKKMYLDDALKYINQIKV